MLYIWRIILHTMIFRRAGKVLVCLFLMVTPLFALSGVSLTFLFNAPDAAPACWSMPPPDTICKGDTLQLIGTYPQATTYNWTPNYNMSSTSSATPLVWPMVTTPYVVQASGVTSNLIFNGDFTFGNVGFTSAYTYTTNLWPEATYYIGINPQLYHTGFSPCVDHTTGNGNMMIVNGSGTPNAVIWQQTVPVAPNTDYQFSTWLTSVHPSSPAQLQFFVNNVQIGPVFTASPVVCVWNNFFNTWNSGTSTTAVISIRNQNTSLAGNDFAIDDIWFAQVIAHTDTHLVVVEEPVVSIGNDTAICPHDTIVLSTGGGFAQYFWSTGAMTPDISVNAPGLYWARVFTNRGCPAADTMSLMHRPLPLIAVLNDSVCPGDTATLTATGPPGAQYLWSTGATGNYAAVAPAVTTSYLVEVTDTLGCRNSASATAVILPLPQVQISPDITVCRGDPTTLTASGGQLYQWSPGGQTTPSITVSPADPATTYSVTVTDANGCQGSASAQVSTVPYPHISLWMETDTICRGNQAAIEASGGTHYLWSTGDLSPNIIIDPTETTTYSVTVSESHGGITCSKDTSLVQYVQDCNLIYLPNAINLSGTNNTFRPHGEFTWAEHYSMAVYNRWGKMLFYTEDFFEGWDGTYDGQKVPEGVYVYEVRMTLPGGRLWRKQGTVTVIR
jgi:gliding motility-associated-like protein